MIVHVYNKQHAIALESFVECDMSPDETDTGLLPQCKAGTCACPSQAKIMRAIGCDGPYVWAYEEPDVIDNEFSDANDAIGPSVRMCRVFDFGKTQFPEGIAIHATPDSAKSPLAIELVLDTNDAATHSAYCPNCQCRTACEDEYGACLVCEWTVLCGECGQSWHSQDKCPACRVAGADSDSDH